MTGKINALTAQLAAKGVHFHGAMDFLDPSLKHSFSMACDAQPGLSTVASSGVPNFILNYMDPEVVRVLFSPMKAAVICGESQKGSWTTKEATFPIVEATGEVSSYGDYSQNGSSGANTNFNTRQSYHYQTIAQWGELEAETMGEAKLSWANEINTASVLTLNKYQNQTYFYGVSGLKLYGLLNDPALPASITPTQAWANAAAEIVYDDVRRLYAQLVAQSGGLIDDDTPMVLSMSPKLKTNLHKTNQFKVNVFDLLKANFENLRIETAPEYDTAGGQLMQLMVESMDGVKTATCAYTEKLRTHATVVKESSWVQKRSQGTWGTIIKRHALIASMIGM